MRLLLSCIFLAGAIGIANAQTAVKQSQRTPDLAAWFW